MTMIRDFSFIYLFGLVVGLGIFVTATWGLSLWPTHSLLVACQLWSTRACGLRCSAAREILVPWPRLKHTSPALQSWFFATDHQGRSPLSSRHSSSTVDAPATLSYDGVLTDPSHPLSFLIFILSPWGFIHPVASARAPRTPASPCLA